MNASKNHEIARARRKLAAGILMQARRDLRRFKRATRLDERELYLDAHDWIISDSCKWRFSFRNVCDLLNLAPEGVRHELLGELSLGTIHYWSRRLGRSVRRFQISLNDIITKARATGASEPGTLIHTHS